jgi:hypothetical protein
MGAPGGMPFRGADPFDRAMAQRKVDLSRGPTGGVGRKSGTREQALGDSVVALILFEAARPSVRESALAAKARDQPELLEGPKVGEGGGGTNVQCEGDLFEARAARFALADRNDAERLHLSMCELLQGLH